MLHNNLSELSYCNPQSTCKLRIIHYGSFVFEPNKFDKIKNLSPLERINRPDGGLWTSPMNSLNSWKIFNIEENDMEEHDFQTYFSMKFTSNARVAIIDSYQDLSKLPLLKNPIGHTSDWELISTLADAVWLTAKGESETRRGDLNLHGWDCESVLIMNPHCITDFQKPL